MFRLNLNASALHVSLFPFPMSTSFHKADL
jgi:hypothetical protein